MKRERRRWAQAEVKINRTDLYLLSKKNRKPLSARARPRDPMARLGKARRGHD